MGTSMPRAGPPSESLLGTTVAGYSIEAHLASRPEPAHAEFRTHVLPYVSSAKTTVHFNPIAEVRAH